VTSTKTNFAAYTQVKFALQVQTKVDTATDFVTSTDVDTVTATATETDYVTETETATTTATVESTVTVTDTVPDTATVTTTVFSTSTEVDDAVSTASATTTIVVDVAPPQPTGPPRSSVYLNAFYNDSISGYIADCYWQYEGGETKYYVTGDWSLFTLYNDNCYLFIDDNGFFQCNYDGTGALFLWFVTSTSVFMPSTICQTVVGVSAGLRKRLCIFAVCRLNRFLCAVCAVSRRRRRSIRRVCWRRRGRPDKNCHNSGF